MLFTNPNEATLQSYDRIVSVVPSQTELLASLGLNNEVLGITRFCIHPSAWKKEKKIIGGTKNLKINEIIDLKPNLIIANKEENVQDQIESLATTTDVFLTDVNSFEEALQMIHDLGRLTGKVQEASRIVENIQIGFEGLSSSSIVPLKAVYLIWNEPLMTIGGDTFINSILNKAGFENVFSNLKRYPEINWEMIATSGADCILLSSEPYPFKEKHLAEFNVNMPHMKTMLVDGEMFSWYGSRMMNAPAYLKRLCSHLSIR